MEVSVQRHIPTHGRMNNMSGVERPEIGIIKEKADVGEIISSVG